MNTKLQVKASEYKKLSDEELVYRYADRHEDEAMIYIFERYGHLVLGVCMKYMNANQAKTVTEEIFIKLLTDLKKFKVEHLKPWLFTYTQNYCMVHTRNMLPVINASAINDPDTDLENEQVSLNSFPPDLLEKMLRELNKDERTCIDMFYTQGMNYAQIAAATNLSIIQVKGLLHSGKQIIKHKITEASAHVKK